MGAEGGEDRAVDDPPTTNEVEDRGVMSEAGVEPTAAAVPDTTTGRTDDDDGDGDDDDSAASRSNPNVEDSMNDDAPREAHGADAATAITPSPSAGDAAAAISPSLSPLSPGSRKKFAVAEVPRWRFVNVAKKTSGYSSVAAGTVVEGISAEELAAKYKGPEIEEEPAKQKTEKTIGKLNLLEVQKEAEETITGSFAGFKKRPSDVRDDGPTKDELATLEGERLESPLVHPRGLSPLMHDLPSQMEENATQPTEVEPAELQILTAEASGDGSEPDRSEKQAEPAVPVELAEPAAHASADEETAERKPPPEEEEEPPRSKRRKLLLLLLLLLLVVLAAALGVLLGGKDSENHGAENKAVDGAVIIGEENNVNGSPSFVPTFSPALSPTWTPVVLEVTSTPPTEHLPVCPANTKLLTVRQGGNDNNNNSNGVEDEQLRDNSMSIWVVKDACNGEEVMRCQPCPMYSSTNGWDALRLQVPVEEDAGANEEHAASGSSYDVSGCLPDDKDYVFEVERSDGAGACCGFDPDSFAVTYNGTEVTRGEPYATNIFSDGDGSDADPSNGGKRYFGRRTEPCPSSDPSTAPSVEPVPTTARPSSRPTKGPTDSPSAKPSCDAEYEDFNLCFAIDASGSVCNQKTGFECYDCEPNIICNEMGIDNSMCCSNFFEVVEFAKLMVETLESVPANQAYTVVRFANDATLASGIAVRPDEATEALEELAYSGGLTNHAAAFDRCRESGSPFPRKDLILLITDGDPSEPPGSAQADAVKAADRAKAEGMSIIPVMIVPEVVTELNPQTVAYLKEISSDGSIFEVSDFSVLETLQGSLLAQVSCQV